MADFFPDRRDIFPDMAEFFPDITDFFPDMADFLPDVSATFPASGIVQVFSSELESGLCLNPENHALERNELNAYSQRCVSPKRVINEL